MRRKKKIRAFNLDEAPEQPLPDWAYHVLKEGEKAYFIKTEQGLIVCCLSSDPSRDGKNLWILQGD